jgi:hypothetical protein
LIELHILKRAELRKIREIDRTETIRGAYGVQAGKPIREDTLWETPNGSDEYQVSLAAM